MGRLLIPTFVFAFGAIWAGFAPAANAAALRGNGTLTATGTGTVAVRGAIDYQATAGAKSILLVKDVAGDANVTVTGETGQAPYGKFTAYFSFASATITGTDVAAVAIGGSLNITAAGHGWAYLKGAGTYSVDGGPSQNWDGAAVWRRSSDAAHSVPLAQVSRPFADCLTIRRPPAPAASCS